MRPQQEGKHKMKRQPMPQGTTVAECLEYAEKSIGSMNQKTMNPLIARSGRRLTLYLTLVMAVFCGIPKPTSAYPTGSMSCSDIGDFAAAAVVGKENGRSLEQALETVRKRTAGYPVERKNLTQIVRAIYTEPWAMHLSEEGASVVFAVDCEAQAD
jgi:hypothetical protein